MHFYFSFGGTPGILLPCGGHFNLVSIRMRSSPATSVKGGIARRGWDLGSALMGKEIYLQI
jgi:hypothetical protein